MAAQDERPFRVHRTGTESFTIIEAHPYHYPVGKLDHKGAGEYEQGYKPECPLCREEQNPQTCPTCGTKLEVLMFMGIEPDGYVCPKCQRHYDDNLRPGAWVIGG